MIVGVKNRRVRSGSVGCGDRRADNQVVAHSDAFCGVDCFAAAKTDRASAVVFLCEFLHFLDFVSGTFAAEIAGIQFDAEFLFGCRKLVFDKILCERVGNKQCAVAECFNEITEVKKFVFALDVFAGADKCFSHNKSPLYKLY